MRTKVLARLVVLSLLTFSFQTSARGLRPVQAAPAVTQIGLMTDPDITESSGLVASRKFPGVFWTHNDHGSSPRLFAVSRNGLLVTKFPVTGATISDWEDISTDDAGNLYLADIGDNDETRDQIQVYRIVEPNPTGSGSVQVNRTWRLKYKDKAHDAETLFIQNGNGYIVTKHRDSTGVELLRFPLSSTSRVTTLESVGRIKVAADVSGGSISRDSSSLALVTDNGAYLFAINGTPANATHLRGYFYTFAHPQMEGSTLLPEGLITSAENGEMFLFSAPPFRNH